MNESYAKKVNEAAKVISEADFILIGGGSGLSCAGGLDYVKRFDEFFSDYKQNYGMTDMYTAGFYPFSSEEEKWAYWSRHIKANRYDAPVGEVYKKLLEIVQNKNYFVITTNVDALFLRAGFDPDKVYRVQGDYGKFQCSVPCSPVTYNNYDAVTEMAERQENFKIPTSLIPTCPVCAAKMEVNIRKDAFFVEDDDFFRMGRSYANFLREAGGRKLVLIEIGVGFNTPGIIRFPFEQITYNEPNSHLIRINKDYAIVDDEIEERTMLFNEDANIVLEDLVKTSQI